MSFNFRILHYSDLTCLFHVLSTTDHQMHSRAMTNFIFDRSLVLSKCDATEGSKEANRKKESKNSYQK